MTAEDAFPKIPGLAGRLVQMPVKPALAFYLIIPVCFALILGSNSAGGAEFRTKEAYVLWALSVTLPVWWMLDGFSHLIAIILRPWRAPLFLILTLAIIPALIMNGPLHIVRESLFADYFLNDASSYPIWPWRFNDPEYLSKFAYGFINGLIVWLPVNYFYLYFLKIDRYGHAAPSQILLPNDERSGIENNESTTSTNKGSARSNNHSASLVLDRLPKSLGTDIVALKAEEHYTNVFTKLGSDLVLMRIGDAIKSLESLPGLQVHRSYWINKRHIKSYEKSGSGYDVTMTTGLKIPVSRSYKVNFDQVISDQESTSGRTG